MEEVELALGASGALLADGGTCASKDGTGPVGPFLFGEQ